MKTRLFLFSILFIIVLGACGHAPLQKTAALTADFIDELEKSTMKKIEAENDFILQMQQNTKFAAKWNVRLETQTALLRSIEKFSDLALTERLGVPQIPLQDFLRNHNNTSRTAIERETKAIADEEAKLAVTFNQLLLQRRKWNEAKESVMQLTRTQSDTERFNYLLHKAEECWKAYKKLEKKQKGASGETSPHAGSN